MSRLILLALLLSANTGGSEPPPASVADVVRVDCPSGFGSAFRISGDRYVSAEHVTSLGNCRIGDTPVRVIHGSGDLAIISTTREGAEFRVDCGGFKRGRAYVAIGHGRGYLLAQLLYATGERQRQDARFDGLHMLYGAVYRGQSGGPVIDAETGAVVGIVNAGNEYNLALSRQLSDTPLCVGPEL